MSKEIKAHVPPFDTVDGGQYTGSVSNTGTITVDTIPLDPDITLTLTDTPEYKFREDELIDEAVMMTFAANETTTVTMLWCVP